MPIDFRCPSCGKLLRVGDQAAGRRAQCPQCNNIATIPPSSVGPAAAADAASPPAAAPPGGTAPISSLRQLPKIVAGEQCGGGKAGKMPAMRDGSFDSGEQPAEIASSAMRSQFAPLPSRDADVNPFQSPQTPPAPRAMSSAGRAGSAGHRRCFQPLLADHDKPLGDMPGDVDGLDYQPRHRFRTSIRCEGGGYANPRFEPYDDGKPRGDDRHIHDCRLS